MIIITDLSISYPKVGDVVRDFSCELHAGSITILMAPSGKGKSSILRTLMGVNSSVNTGRLIIGSDQYDLKDWRNEGGVFGLVPQSPHLLPWKTVEENISLAFKSKTLATSINIKDQVTELLETTKLTDARTLYPREISLGMASRVSFARTLALKPKALLLDEPFASLDALTREQLQDWLITTVHAANQAVLFVTHDLQEAKRLGREIIEV